LPSTGEVEGDSCRTAFEVPTFRLVRVQEKLDYVPNPDIHHVYNLNFRRRFKPFNFACIKGYLFAFSYIKTVALFARFLSFAAPLFESAHWYSLSRTRYVDRSFTDLIRYQVSFPSPVRLRTSQNIPHRYNAVSLRRRLHPRSRMQKKC
jgi:hypothetical protein